MKNNLFPEMRSVLEAAVRAPSGENCQPWRFVVRGNEVDIYLRPEQDRSAYNWEQRAAYFAVGAAIENAVIAASEKGMSLTITPFPNAKDPLLVARGTLVRDGSAPDPLVRAIWERVTNRKPYRTDPLTEEETKALFEAGNQGSISCKLTDDRGDMKKLGAVGSMNEVVMLGNRFLHEFFFSHINWTKEEDDRKKIGFFIDTLELPLPARTSFMLMRSWTRNRTLNLLGFNKVVGAINAGLNARAAAIGTIAATENTPAGAVEAGRVLERVWLTATALGLNFQPLAGILYFYLRVAAGDRGHFSDADIARITKAHETVDAVFHLEGKTHFFMFRVGRGEPPTARATRLALEDVVSIA